MNKLNERGLWEGIWKIYHDNGQLWYECNYIDGKRNCFYKSYYNNGQLNWEGNYLMGNLIGLCKFYNKLGELTSKYYYE